MPDINWGRIGRAVAFYTNRGYTYLEVPWIVEAESTEVTLPAHAKALKAVNHLSYRVDGVQFPLNVVHSHGDLVGSAEQSFIQLMREGRLPQGHYVAVSPCFRIEPEYNERYQPYFMKVELINVGGIGEIDVDAVTEDALSFFRSEMSDEDSEAFECVLQDGTAMDIELAGIEIGSYGEREWENFRWVYGTGLAEPRFSVARNALWELTDATL